MKSKKVIFYGWWVALASAIIIFFAGGLAYYSLSAYFDSIVAEFGWKRATISGAYSVRSLESGILTPVVGFLLDRIGPRILFLVGVTMCSLGLVILGSMDSVLTLYIAFAVISVGGSACSISTAVSATAKWFIRKRGRALGLTTAGGGASGLFVAIAAWLIVTFGWRQSLYISAAAIFIICLPLSLLIRHRPEEYGLLPDGEQQGAVTLQPGKALPGDADFTSKQALKTSAFWLIALSMGFQYVGVFAVIVHLIPFLTGIGLSTQSAALVMTVTIVISLAGRFCFGWLADAHDPRFLMALSFLLTAAGLFILAFTQSTFLIFVFLSTFGMSYASRVPLAGALQGQYFGRKSYGAIQGLIHSLTVVFGIAGPVLTGWLYDTSGSYQTAFLVMGGIVLVSVPLTLLIRQPQSKAIPL